MTISRERPVHAPAPEDSTGRRVTILDVARVAEVSPSAVSKVVRGAYGVSANMRERVNQAIDQLGYRPHAGARAMRGRSYTIGVVLPALDTPFPIEITTTIANELEGGPFQEVIVVGGAEPARYRRRVDNLIDRQVDGLLLVAPWFDGAEIEELGRTVPIVTVALHGSAHNFDTVVDDEYLGARLVVDHLVQQGHQRIVHTSMPSLPSEGTFLLSHTARRRGFKDAMRKHRLTPDVIQTWYSEAGGYEAAMQALNRPQRPTAIFAGADIAALGVLRAAEELGLRVPEDLSVVGYDNIYAASIHRVSLTTVDQSGSMTGEASLRLLMERIEGRTEPKQYVIAPQLIVRGTSGPAAPMSGTAISLPERARGRPVS